MKKVTGEAVASFLNRKPSQEDPEKGVFACIIMRNCGDVSFVVTFLPYQL